MSDPAKLLKSHAASWLHDRRPTLASLLRCVTKGDDASDHWVWQLDSDTSNPRRLSEHGQAIISWTPNTNVKRGIFCVARLLNEYLKGPFPERAIFMLQCGRPQCVNPDHWKWIPPLPRYRFDPSEFGWRIAERRTGKPVKQRLLLAMLDERGVSHTAPAEPRPTSRFVAMCGALITPEVSTVLATNAVITCKGGC